MVKFLKISQKKEFTSSNFENLQLLYKSCGFRKEENFQEITTINIGDGKFEFYGKNIGRQTNKNIVKILDSEVIAYGNIAVLYKVNNIYENLTLTEYNNLITKKPEIKEEDDLHLNNNVLSESITESDDDSDDDIDLISNPELEPESYLYTSDEEIS